MKKLRRPLSLIIAVLIVFAMVPVQVLALDAFSQLETKAGELNSWIIGHDIEDLNDVQSLSVSGKINRLDLQAITTAIADGGFTNLHTLDFSEAELVGSVEIPAGFLKDAAVTTVSLPKGATTIGASAFEGSALSVIAMDEVTVIGANAFSNCDSLVLTKLPENLLRIGDYAFSGTGVAFTAIPKTVTTLGKGVFKDCPYITKLLLPNANVAIDRLFFEGASALEMVALPKSISTLFANYFAVCAALTSIAVPAGMSKIEKDAFAGTALAGITFEGNAPINIAEGAFENILSLRILAGTEAAGFDTLHAEFPEDTVVITGSVSGSGEYEPGDTLTLEATLSDTTGVQYQWYHNGQEIVGATSQKYSKKLSSSDEGEYICLVSFSDKTEMKIPGSVQVTIPPLPDGITITKAAGTPKPGTDYLFDYETGVLSVFSTGLTISGSTQRDFAIRVEAKDPTVTINKLDISHSSERWISFVNEDSVRSTLKALGKNVYTDNGSYAVYCESGSLTVTGAQRAILDGHDITVNDGDLTLSALSLSSNYKVSAPNGNITISDCVLDLGDSISAGENLTIKGKTSGSVYGSDDQHGDSWPALLAQKSISVTLTKGLELEVACGDQEYFGYQIPAVLAGEDIKVASKTQITTPDKNKIEKTDIYEDIASFSSRVQKMIADDNGDAVNKVVFYGSDKTSGSSSSGSSSSGSSGSSSSGSSSSGSAADSKYWQELIDDIGDSRSGSTLRAEMTERNNLSVEVLNALKGKDLTLELTYQGKTLSINGKNMKSYDSSKKEFTFKELQEIFDSQSSGKPNPGTGA